MMIVYPTQQYWDDRYGKQRDKTVGCNSFTIEQFSKKTEESIDLAKAIIDPIFIGRRVLDFGSGVGRFSAMLSQFCSHVHGVDISEWAIGKARTRSPKCDFKVYDGRTIPYGNEFFEGCFSWTVLQHIPPTEINGICDEISRVLKGGSPLVIYENISTWQEDKVHIWFRRPKDYMIFFPEFRVESEKIVNDFDRTGEDHVLFVFRKNL
jgi:ubiquinone/menaquinone biosynthesis C-methylase UbiE